MVNIDPKLNKLLLSGNFEDIKYYIKNYKINSYHFGKIILNINLKWDQVEYIYDTAKLKGLFADINCFRRLLYFYRINTNYINLFMKIVFDIISSDISNLLYIIRRILQNRKNKIPILIKTLNEIYIGITRDMFHKILTLKSNYEYDNLLAILYHKITQGITIETLHLAYVYEHYKFLEYIIPSKKQLVNFYHFMT